MTMVNAVQSQGGTKYMIGEEYAVLVWLLHEAELAALFVGLGVYFGYDEAILKGDLPTGVEPDDAVAVELIVDESGDYSFAVTRMGEGGVLHLDAEDAARVLHEAGDYLGVGLAVDDPDLEEIDDTDIDLGYAIDDTDIDVAATGDEPVPEPGIEP